MTLSEDSFHTSLLERKIPLRFSFIGQTKIPATIQYSFEIEAKVESWNNLPYGQLPDGPWVVNTSHIGDLNIESYGMVELLLSDVTTRYMDTQRAKLSLIFKSRTKVMRMINSRLSLQTLLTLKPQVSRFPGGNLCE
jgi:hypothetical protein